MAAVLKHWREAATLILVSSSKLSGATFQLVSNTLQGHKNNVSKIPSDLYKENYDVLLLKRSSKSKFMPNLYVFPGGVAVDSDFQSSWIDVFKNLGSDVQKSMFQKLSAGSSRAPQMLSRQREEKYSSIPAEVAFRICAIRETFEESGVLLAWPVSKVKEIGRSLLSQTESGTHDALFDLPVDSDSIVKWRHRVNSDPKEFFNMCQELQLVPAIWTLCEWANWLTPTLAAENSRRFDTIFYICCIDHKPDVAEDKGETVSAQWAKPSSVLVEHFRKKCGVAPPQVYELSRLLNFRTMKGLQENISDPQRERVERIFPVLSLCQDHSIALMPGDELYPKEPDLYEKGIVEVPSMTSDELISKFPSAHRSLNPFKGGHVTIQCSIPDRRKGNVMPKLDVVDELMVQAHTKL